MRGIDSFLTMRFDGTRRNPRRAQPSQGGSEIGILPGRVNVEDVGGIEAGVGGEGTQGGLV